jgi:TIR domain
MRQDRWQAGENAVLHATAVMVRSANRRTLRRGIAVSRIFLSHSNDDNAPAIALRDWLLAEGWNDLFLDLDPERGIAAGERWERKLNQSASRCEAVLFLVSKAWLSSRWCIN